MRIYVSDGFWKYGRNMVMIGDNNVYAQFSGNSYFFHRSYTAVNRYNKPGPSFRYFLYGFGVNTVPFGKSVRNIIANVRPECTERSDHYRGGSNRISIVI